MKSIFELFQIQYSIKKRKKVYRGRPIFITSRLNVLDFEVTKIDPVQKSLSILLK